MTTGLASAIVIATAIVLFTSNITTINAQQQFTNQSGEVIQNGTTIATMTFFESRNDSFRVQVPEGWVIDDVNNTGSTMSSELTQGYGILAELCPVEEEGGGGQQQEALTNVSSSSNSSSICQQQQQAQGEIIHIVRYPNLSARLQLALGVDNANITTDNILSYHLQKLEQVGYRSIEIVNNTETTVNVTNAETNQTIQIVPAKFVEMTYVTNFAPNEIREGYFISTATNATAPDPGVTKGYSIFYEGNSTAANVTSVAQMTTTSGNLLPPLPATVRQVFDSFELVAAEELPQTVGNTTDDDTGGNTGSTVDDDDTGGNTGGGTDVDDDDTGGGTEPTDLLRVDIISNGTQGVAPATFEFQANVTGGTEPYTYLWNFDEDNVENDGEQDVVHTFDEAGSYNVTLGVTDSEDLNASDSVVITVLPAPETGEEGQSLGEELVSQTGPPSPAPPNDNGEMISPPEGGGEEEETTTTNQDTINNSPVASNVQVTTNQDTPVPITLQATDEDAGDSLTFSVSEAANGGQITNFDNKAGTLTYTPPAGFSGQDAFNFKAVDSRGGESNTATVIITINTANQSPVASNVEEATTTPPSDNTEEEGREREGGTPPEIIREEDPSPPPPAEEGEEKEEEEETVCDSSYPDLCLAPPPPDLDCGDDGVPENFQVLPPDPHGFDSDNDGIGCDSESNDAVVEPESSNND